MLFLIGLVIVIVCVLGGYQAHGDLKVLWQPIEFVIIFGAAIGAYLISNPMDVIKDSLKVFGWLFKAKPYKKADYIELLKFFFEIFKLIKTKGLLQIEPHIEDPKNSEIFNKYPSIAKDPKVVQFFCDNIRLLTLGIDNHYVMEEAMSEEIEIIAHEGHQAAHALSVFGDSLPALGIVAAILGVIITMGSISEPPEILGGLIGAALVGSFSGILFSYGIFSPIGAFATTYSNAQIEYIKCIKVAIISNMQGNAPAITVEIARKIIPVHERPTFHEIDQAINNASN